MWTQNNYRRIFLDTHIADDQDVYFSKLDPEALFRIQSEAGAQQIVVKGRTHTGLANYPTKFGRMNRCLHGMDYVGTMTSLCHAHGIAVKGYFSQIFDNWAYENHPSWRMVNKEGKSSRDYEDYNNLSMFRRGRYGIVCPNNPEYREYVRGALTELAENYRFESIFLDMPFWPEVCFCDSCRERYRKETGRELPETANFDDPEFLDFMRRREKWMAEFTALSASYVKAAQPDCCIEQNLGGTPASCWVGGTSDLIAEQCEYISGDLYGGYFEEAFICKFIRNLSNTLPFVYITSRCDPDLYTHTATRTADEFVLFGAISLAHTGALEVCDGINPDGTVVTSAYKIIGEAFSRLEPYVPYAGGEIPACVDLWLPTFSKFDRAQNGMDLADARVWGDFSFLNTKKSLAGILRSEHIPYNVWPSSRLSGANGDVLAITGVELILDEEMDQIEAYLRRGGNLFLTGRPAHPRLLSLLEAVYEGETEHDVTYMAPQGAGKELLSEFSEQNPFPVNRRQSLLSFSGVYEPLATLTLPYTMTGKREFSSIHSNPPGKKTSYVSMLRKKVGAGTIFWTAAPIQMERSYFCRCCVGRILRSLCSRIPFTAEAPPFVEILPFIRDGKKYLAILNEQETVPAVPMDGIKITLSERITSARTVVTDLPVPVEQSGSCSVLSVPKVHLFHIIEISQ